MEQITREQIIGLLKVAECPASCDNGVVVRDLLHDEIEQCQFCFERLKTIAALQAAEPVACQRRMRPTWDSRHPWTNWEDCSKGTYDDCLRVPYLHDWEHRVRALFTLPCLPAKANGMEERLAEIVSRMLNTLWSGKSKAERVQLIKDAQNTLEDYRSQPAKAQEPLRQRPTDAAINEITLNKLGKWPSFEAQSWACEVVKAVLSEEALDWEDEAAEKMEQAGFYTAPHARGLLNVPVAAYDPDVCTPAMEAAAEKYWKERRFKGLSEDARTWKGLYKAMCAARKQNPAPDELSDYDRGFRDGKLDPLIDEVVAESELAEELGSLIKGYVKLLEAGMDRITSLGGDCDPVFVMDKNDPWLRDARTALSAYRKRNER